jgi:hypothetical protein
MILFCRRIGNVHKMIFIRRYDKNKNDNDFSKAFFNLVYFDIIQKVTQWSFTLTIFFMCCFLAISTVIVYKYFVWKSKYYYVYILLLLCQIISHLSPLSSDNKLLTFV